MKVTNFGKIRVYTNIRRFENGEFRDGAPEIDWPALGSVSIDDAEAFAKNLMAALEFAKQQNEGE